MDVEPTRMEDPAIRAGALLTDWHAEADDIRSAPSGEYVLLVLFPYYNSLLGVNLVRAGLAVRYVRSLEDAWTLIAIKQPRVVVCWVGRLWLWPSPPDGLALLKQIRSSSTYHPHTVAIVGKHCNTETAKSAGADSAFAVPFVPLEFVNDVKRLFG